MAMMQTGPQASRRRGAVTSLAAVLMIPMLGMLAFAVDMGYVVMAKAELQSAADAAALAAAEQLNSYYVQYYSPSANQSNILSSAQSTASSFASKYASFHQAGSTTSVVLDTTNDVKFGYMDASTPYQCPPPTGYFPNTVEVTLRLDGGASTNPQVNVFFGNVLGMGQVSVIVTARATIYNGDVTDISGAPSSLLPAILDTQIWDNFVATGQGSLPDFSYMAPTSYAPNPVPAPAVAGAPQIQLAPDPSGRPGGWNYLSLNSRSTNTNDFQSWFSNGPTQCDITALHTGGQLSLPAQPSDPTNATYFWKGAPGDDGNSQPFPPPGALRILPLYAHVPVSQSGPDNYIAGDKNSGPWDGQSGGESNCWFNVVRFVGVVVTDNSNGLCVQPAAVADPKAVISNLQPAGPPPNGNQIKTFFGPPKLTY
jgi:Flp pilus assembly protein TadG